MSEQDDPRPGITRQEIRSALAGALGLAAGVAATGAAGPGAGEAAAQAAEVLAENWLLPVLGGAFFGAGTWLRRARNRVMELR